MDDRGSPLGNATGAFKVYIPHQHQLEGAVEFGVGNFGVFSEPINVSQLHLIKLNQKDELIYNFEIGNFQVRSNPINDNQLHNIKLNKNIDESSHMLFMNDKGSSLGNATGAFKVYIPHQHQLKDAIELSVNDYNIPIDPFNFGAWNEYEFTLTT